MARFLLKFKLRGRANRDRPDLVVERDHVVLGSRPLADVYVNDRLVPLEAMSFHFDGFQISIDLKGRLAGVFVDGHPVEGRGPVRPGAIVQIGHTLVETHVDVAKDECTLTTNEQYLSQVVDGIVMKAKPEQPFALVDSGPQEHRWGKSPVLRLLTWSAAFLGVLALAAFPFARNSEAMTRGPLHHAHAIGSEGGPKDCAACHAPFASNYDAKCSECHKGYASTASHPYERMAGLACNECHGEHIGADARISPELPEAPTAWPAQCVTCHAGQPFPAQDVPGDVVARAKSRLRDQPGAPFSRPLMADGFSHADHRKASTSRISPVPGGAPKRGEAPVACAECHHVLGKGERNASVPTADYAQVTYRKCLECHAGWDVPVHGREDGGKACYQCHVAADTPEHITEKLKTVKLPDTGSKWVLKPRAHDFAKDECLACHVLEKSSPDQRVALGEKLFRHDHHLRTLAPSRGGELALSQDCLACHKDVAGSDTLAGVKLVDTSGCVACHVNSEPVPVEAKGAEREVPDMVHSRHTADAASRGRGALRYSSHDALSGGCLSCHVPAAGAVPMGMKRDARGADVVSNCKACHTGHENLGAGKCVLCHIDRAGPNVQDGRTEYRFNDPGIFAPNRPVVKTTAAIKSFRHTSPGHDGHECVECHRVEDVDRAVRVLDVPWPAFDEDSCVKCHVRERFHR